MPRRRASHAAGVARVSPWRRASHATGVAPFSSCRTEIKSCGFLREGDTAFVCLAVRIVVCRSFSKFTNNEMEPASNWRVSLPPPRQEIPRLTFLFSIQQVMLYVPPGK